MYDTICIWKSNKTSEPANSTKCAPALCVILAENMTPQLHPNKRHLSPATKTSLSRFVLFVCAASSSSSHPWALMPFCTLLLRVSIQRFFLCHRFPAAQPLSLTYFPGVIYLISPLLRVWFSATSVLVGTKKKGYISLSHTHTHTLYERFSSPFFSCFTAPGCVSSVVFACCHPFPG